MYALELSRWLAGERGMSLCRDRDVSAKLLGGLIQQKEERVSRIAIHRVKSEKSLEYQQ